VTLRPYELLRARGERFLPQRWAYRILGTLVLSPLLVFLGGRARTRLLDEGGIWVLSAVALVASCAIWLVLERLLGPSMERVASRVNRHADRRFEVLRVWDVPILVDWSLLALLIAALPAAVYAPADVATTAASYFLILLVHELGHLLAVRRFGGRVVSIEVNALHGQTNYFASVSVPPVPIAWAGVVAQLLVAVPFCVEWLAVERDDPGRTALRLLGPWNAVLAGINLLPLRGLDGEVAWRAFRRPTVGRGVRPRGWKR
jgi:hypothetical protein